VAVGVPVSPVPEARAMATQLVEPSNEPEVPVKVESWQVPRLVKVPLIEARVVEVSSVKAAALRPVTASELLVKLETSMAVGTVQVVWKTGLLQYIIKIEPMVAPVVVIVNLTVWAALAPLPPSPGGTAVPAALVLISPVAEELSFKLREVKSSAAWVRWVGTITGIARPTIRTSAAPRAKVRLNLTLKVCELDFLFSFFIFIF
jgi:hypothetical protein